MGQLIILGAGTMAQEVTDLIEDTGKHEIIAYCVNTNWQKDSKLLGKPILWVDELLNYTDKGIRVVRAIFSPICYSFIKEVENMGFNFVHIIHPSASVSQSARIGRGTIINRLVSIGYDTIIGNHCLINRGCTIGHHCKLDEGVTLGPGVNIAGNVQIGKRTLIGMGSNIIQNVIIDNDQKIRAASLVIK